MGKVAFDLRRAAALCATVLLCSGAAQAVPLLSIEGGTGVPGGTVDTILSLSADPERTVVSADLTVNFEAPPLFAGTTSCTIAARLDGSHELAADTPGAGRLHVAITPADAAVPLDEGPLATCTFMIDAGAPAGTAALTLSGVVLRDADGDQVPAETAGGEIVIESSGPTPTATIPAPSTATATVTATLPPVDTPTITPTPTSTPVFITTVIVDRFGGCAVVEPQRDHMWPWAGAVVLLAVTYTLRRRSK